MTPLETIKAALRLGIRGDAIAAMVLIAEQNPTIWEEVITEWEAEGE